MTEKAFVKLLCRKLAKFGAFRIENAACPGTPDIGTIGPYIEVKVWNHHLWTYDTAVSLLRPAQKAWAVRHIRAGGSVILYVYSNCCHKAFNFCLTIEDGKLRAVALGSPHLNDYRLASI